MTSVALFIPTLNAVNACGDRYTKNLHTIKQANLDQVLIIDSSSVDSTVDMARGFGFDSVVIAKKDFDHSGTRQLALKMLSHHDIVIYLTQDALLKDVNSLISLIRPLQDNSNIAGVYGRQFPHDNADIFAKHLREFNYSSESYIRNYNNRFIWGMKCVFASDSFAAYRVDSLLKVGGFPDSLILGEDVYIFARLLQNKYSVAYAAEAVCYHSHNYSIKDDFNRYFDIGVFHRAENWILQDFGYPSKQGVKYVISELSYIKYRFWLWPKSIAKLAVKYIGYKLGYNYDLIGAGLCRCFSMNKSFWW
ncbi:MAG: glycosyltransferase family 2 protein [Proteobacteria bacterium]|jgi:rhamnosyltransferase|nr:glycosyltransferase family 2 protein [Pseudomonadota bacterium]